MMVARAQPRVVIFTQQEQLGALLVGQSHWQWGRSRHRQQPLKNKSDAIEYIIITTYTSMPYFCHISLGRPQDAPVIRHNNLSPEQFGPPTSINEEDLRRNVSALRHLLVEIGYGKSYADGRTIVTTKT